MPITQKGERATPRLDLGVALQEFRDQPGDFIATQVLPIFTTMKKESVYSAITRESYTSSANVARAARSPYNRVGIETKDKNYSCQEYGIEGPVDDTQARFYASLTFLATRYLEATRRLLQIAPSIDIREFFSANK